MSNAKSIIDETFITLNLKGGNLHSELLYVEASFNKGQFKGQSVPLKCQWYNITKDNDFVEIEDVAGQFYQPCILDIDTKIMVQALPILDFEYNGMPLVAETNFLQADHKIFDLVNQAFNEGVLSLSCKLENIQGTIPESLCHINLPALCQLLANENGLQLQGDQNKNLITLPRYELKIVKKNNNQIDIFSDDVKYMISLSNHIVRDALYQFSKTLKGKKTNLNDTAQLYAKLTDQEQQLIKLEKEIAQLEEQKGKQKQIINEQQTSNIQLIKKVEQLEKQYQATNIQMQNKEKDIANLKSQIDKLDGKTQFYVQEIKVLKSQAIALDNQNKKYLAEIEELKKSHHENQDDLREIFYREKLDNLKQQHDKCCKENQQWQLINDQLMKEIKKLESSNLQFQEEKEILQNELNNLKRKYESLVQEAEINQKKENAECQSMQSDSNSNKQSEILSSQIINQNNNVTQEEIKRLKTTITNLEATIKNLKNEYEQDMLKFTTKHFLKSNSSQEVQIFQKLANSLAESLSDKEQALQTQRSINRELITKIQELSK